MKRANVRRLCDLFEIELFGPKRGEGEVLSLASQQALLAALGMEISGDCALETAGAALAKNRWQQLIPPVLVVGQELHPLALALRLPREALVQPLHWRFVEENGSVREDTVSLAGLALLEETKIDGADYVSLQLALTDLKPPAGYHQLTVECGDGTDRGLSGHCTLIITPPRCYIPPGLEQGARIWGLTCHLDAIRSRRNWGIGDLTDLKNTLHWAAENGAGTVSVASLLSRPLPGEEPLYPGLPSSRCFLDPLYLDLETIADFNENVQIHALVNDPAFQVRLAHLRESEQVEHAEVAAIKRTIFEALWQHFQLNHLNPETDRGWRFRQFQNTGGPRLQAFALYEALQDHCRESAQEQGQQLLWPPTSPEAIDFARTARERLEYHQYLQWQLELQLAEVGTRSMELGLKVGLTQSLPAGVDADGFDAWWQPSLFGQGLRVCDNGDRGDCCPFGPPVLPAPLAAMGYEPLIAMLRFNMHYAGALCFRSVDMLERQLWDSADANDPEKVYLVQRTADLLGIIALESQRNRCLVIGEHRGLLSESFAEALRHRGILVSRPGFFEKDQEENCLVSSCAPAQSVIMASRYDLCSLDAFWQGRDLALLSTLCPAFDNESREHAVIARALDRAYLLVALQREDLLPPGVDLDPAGVPTMTPALIRAVFLFLARSPAKIFLVPLVDLPAETDQDRAPDDQTPKPVWRQRLPTDIESLAADEPLQQLFREFCRERGLGVVRPSVPLVDRRKRQEATIPRSFYRLQFSRDFTFLQAAALIPYLKELGISHCYASPYLKARPGSLHGYDIIDHGSLNPEIGSREEYEAFVTSLDRNGMAQILDIVPNHMGVGPDNQWWVDVLENGQASLFANFFDINWQSQVEELKNRILLPVLGDHFGVVLEEGKLRLVFLADRGSFFIAYYEHLYPIAPKTYPQILGHDLQRLETRVGSQHEGLLELQSLCISFANIPGSEELAEEMSGEQREMRARNKEVLKRLLARLCREVPEVALFIEENVIYYNGEPGRAKSFDPLEKLLAQQVYRLAFWRVASDEINYRRFFDINDLAGIRMECKDVFDATHGLILDLIATGKIDGLRIDHPDGLYDPGAYFRMLQAAAGAMSLDQRKTVFEQPSLRDRQATLPLYIVAEKILSDLEPLPDDWLVHGTSGYDFSCLLNGLFVDQAAEAEITAIYHRFIDRQIDFAGLVHDSKRRIMKTAMAGEINVLCDQLHRLAKQNRYTQDYTLNSLREALTEIVAFFPVYRTYCTADSLSENDRQHIEVAIDRARNNQQAEDTSIYDFIKSVLLLEVAPLADDWQKKKVVDFVMKFQQYTGPVMAKGLEDTAFYIYNRLLSLNEVGSDPRRFGVSVAVFHATNQARSERWPSAMLNTSTHDSKRSEDVRARINVLSEMPSEWRDALNRWRGLNRDKKKITSQGAAPSPNDEYALYQNLLGVWPFEEMTAKDREVLRERMVSSMLKAIREAKVHTSWVRQNAEYEAAMAHFIGELLEDKNHAFLDDFTRFQKNIAWFGMINSLSQLLLKLTAPGVPDIYQGNEIWHFCLVDPDNRRPVDFEKRSGLLTEVGRFLADTSVTSISRSQILLNNPGDGRVKMYLLMKTLSYRRNNPSLFEHGSYLPIAVEGSGKDHVCAFARQYRKQTLIVAAPRLVARLLHRKNTRMPLGRDVWSDTVIPLAKHLKGRVFRNVLTDEEIIGPKEGNGLSVADLFSHFPLALLTLN